MSSNVLPLLSFVAVAVLVIVVDGHKSVNTVDEGECWSSMSLHTFGLTDSLCGTLHESAEFVCVGKPFIAFHDIASKQLHMTFLSGSKQSDWHAEQLHGHAFADSTHQVKQAHHYMQNLKHA